MAKTPRFISSGVSSLDLLLGSGLPLGSLLIIEEDINGKYSKILGKYYLAEGIVEKEAVYFATIENDSEKTLSELPAPTLESDETHNKSSDMEMKVAFRYTDLRPVNSSIDCDYQKKRNFDLSKTLDKSVLNDATIFTWKSPGLDSISDLKNIAYDDLLKSIQEQIIKHKNSNKVLRVYIESLGSPFWNIYRDLKHGSTRDEFDALSKFVYCLRIILRQSTAVAVITIPTHLLPNDDCVEILRHSADAAVKLDSFAGTERESIAALRDYHGFFSVPKLPSVSTPSSALAMMDLVFKLRRKKFIIEKLHLPPELQESSEREQDDSPSCSSVSKRNLDF